jgi:peptidoglycan hydrolase CwlO-like protein
MAKKKVESLQDILDRIQEDIENLRDKVDELESGVESDFDDEEDEE